MKLKTDPWAAASLLDDARQRVVDMSRISRRLSERAAAAMGFKQYLQLLCADLQSEAAVSSHEIVGTVSDDVDIIDPEKLLALSVLIGEAVSNALKDAFRDHQGDYFRRSENNHRQPVPVDDSRQRSGPAGRLRSRDGKDGRLIVIQAMAVQLGGKLETEPSPRGTILIVIFEI